MLRFRIQELCAERGIQHEGKQIDSSYKLQLKCGLKSPAGANRVWKGTNDRVALSTLEQLCIGLECGIADLFLLEIEEPKKTKRSTNAKAEKIAKPASRKPAAKRTKRAR